MKTPKADHVRLDTRTSFMTCEHCGAEERLETPVSVRALTKIVNAYIRKHAKCPRPPWPLAEEVAARRMHALLGPGNALRRRYELLHDGNILDTEGLDPEIVARWKRDRPEFFSNALGLELRPYQREILARARAAMRSGKPTLAVRAMIEESRAKRGAHDARKRPPTDRASTSQGGKTAREQPSQHERADCADLPPHDACGAAGPASKPKPPLAMPRANPCGSCPYRCDVPSGIWDPSEYSKLPAYDAETFAQPIAPFFCHTQDGTVCAGWLGTHGADQLLAVRLGVSSGRLDPSCLDASTDVPLFGSGEAAAAHGLKGVKRPSPKAREVIRKLTRAQAIKASKPAKGKRSPCPGCGTVLKAPIIPCPKCGWGAI